LAQLSIQKSVHPLSKENLSPITHFFNPISAESPKRLLTRRTQNSDFTDQWKVKTVSGSGGPALPDLSKFHAKPFHLFFKFYNLSFNGASETHYRKGRRHGNGLRFPASSNGKKKKLIKGEKLDANCLKIGLSERFSMHCEL
jgi:hypothetical protein